MNYDHSNYIFIVNVLLLLSFYMLLIMIIDSLDWNGLWCSSYFIDFRCTTHYSSIKLILNIKMQQESKSHPQQILPYTIDNWSSHSANYHPSNILVHLPSDQSSRWSSGTNNQAQFITLKLTKPSIARKLLFIECPIIN